MVDLRTGSLPGGGGGGTIRRAAGGGAAAGPSLPSGLRGGAGTRSGAFGAGGGAGGGFRSTRASKAPGRVASSLRFLLSSFCSHPSASSPSACCASAGIVAEEDADGTDEDDSFRAASRNDLGIMPLISHNCRPKLVDEPVVPGPGALTSSSSSSLSVLRSDAPAAGLRKDLRSSPYRARNFAFSCCSCSSLENNRATFSASSAFSGLNLR
mmetsp:Transcript_16882/g.39440  ORF Transcript_16882/g.39440 Transcript_16882/m.39440 type:complete len:211 (-) Transcript_16882:183-815(-)